MKDEIIKIVAKILEVNEEEVNEDTAIGDIPTWDSLHHLNIVSTIEKKFGVRFTPDVLMEMEDVSDIIQATEDRMKK